MKGLASLGAAHYYSEIGLLNLDTIQEFAGCSIGSAIVVLFAVGYKPMEVFSKIYTSKSLFSAKHAQHNRLSLKDFGMLSIQPFIDFLEEMIKAKMGGTVPTMRELYEKRGKFVVISVTNEKKMRGEYITPITEPDTLCTVAIAKSCNLPIIFKRIDGYVDGGLTDPCPVRKIDDGKSKILCLVTQNTREEVEDDNSSGLTNELIRYLYHLIVIPMEQNLLHRIEHLGDNVTLVRMRIPRVSMISLDMPTAEKMNVFMYGYGSARIEDSTTLLQVTLDEDVDEWEEWEDIDLESL